LQALGFEFDGEAAEWERWFNEIAAFSGRHGHCQPHPLAHPNGEARLWPHAPWPSAARALHGGLRFPLPG
jgi:hypothetical protein